MISDVNVLRNIIYNKNFRNLVAAHIDEKLFIDVHCKELWKESVEYVKKYGKFPTGELEMLILDNPWKQPKEAIDVKLDIIKCDPKSFSENNFDVLKSETTNWIRHRMLGETLKTGISVYKDEKNEYSTLAQEISFINNFSFENEKVTEVGSDDLMLDLYRNPSPRLKTGWSHFNDALGGGFKLKSLNIIQGGVHQGKSRFLFSLATNLMMCDKMNDILYVTLEMPVDDFLQSADCHMFQLSTGRIRDMACNDTTKYLKMRDEFKKMYGRLFIREFPASSCTPNVIKNTVDQYLNKGIKLKAVFIDYIGIMSPNHKSTSLYEKGSVNSIDLRSISQEYTIPFMSATQPDREGNRKNLTSGDGADMMNTAESKGIPDNSDLFCNLRQTKEMYNNNVQYMCYHKNRHGNRIFFNSVLNIKKDLYQVEIVGEDNDEVVVNDKPAEYSKPKNKNVQHDFVPPDLTDSFSIPSVF